MIVNVRTRKKHVHLIKFCHDLKVILHLKCCVLVYDLQLHFYLNFLSIFGMIFFQWGGA